MALQKQSIPVNFSQGLETKTDPFQVPIGKFLTLENSVFTKGGLLQKRNGYGNLTSLPDTSSTLLTTYNGNLTSLGTNLYAYSASNNSWLNKGQIQPVNINTLSVVRSSTNQVQADSVIAANGLMCTVFTDVIPSGGSVVNSYKYVISDSVTGQNIVPSTVIPTASGAITNAPRVFLLGNYFVIVFTNLISATNHLQYVAISIANPTMVTGNTNITSQYTPATTLAFDGVVSNNRLYIAWNGSDVGGAIRVTSLSSGLQQSNTVFFATYAATIMSLASDETLSTPTIYVSFYDSNTSNGYTLVLDQSLNTILNPTQIITSESVANITSNAKNMMLTFFYEVSNTYSYGSTLPTNYIKKNTITQAGVVGSGIVLIRSVGLASKSHPCQGDTYFLSVYASTYQPTYFLVNSSGKIVSKLAYENAAGYYTTGLPSLLLSGTNTLQTPYLYKDLIQSVNKTQGLSNPEGIYAQTGINLASFTITTSSLASAEIGSNLNISGGFLLSYDGYEPVENGFFLWPDNVYASTATTGGTLTAQQYFYVATYEWSDNQGNIYRSAPSIPITVTTTGTTSSNTVDVPTLRLTYKTTNPVKIVIYRWSTGQQVYYQVTSITNPLLNDTTVDSVSFLDIQPDTAIVGNSILYTTGGVLENISPPANDTITLYQSRLWLVDSEDKNLLWFSKQVIENTPVEMSDLLTLYVAPTTAAQGNTGPITSLSALDDKLIIFKKDAIYYITGNGPDNTGANSQYSEPVFITSTVGCSNQKSIVFIPDGLMFQSDKGIWLLNRGLGTTYIGAPVESLTQNAFVQSAVNVPGTNQVRFTMDSGVTLMYDYFYGQWGTFTNVPAISSTLYQGMHTYLNKYGQVLQETPNKYLDGSTPVLLNFTTSWINLAGLQGFERAYFFYMLGSYISPHKLSVGIAYDYEPSPSQSVVITPDNYNTPWGGNANWGSSPNWGGHATLEQWRIFFKKQKCQSFQIAIKESFDPSYGTIAGAGLTMSGLDLVIGLKSGYPRIKPARSVG